jgi:hypothetical protein
MPPGFPVGFSFQSDLGPLGQNLGLYYAVDICEAHVTPAKLHTAFSFRKKEKSLPVSQEAFHCKLILCLLGQNFGLNDAMDVCKAHIAPTKLHTAFSFRKKEKSLPVSGRLFDSKITAIP